MAAPLFRHQGNYWVPYKPARHVNAVYNWYQPGFGLNWNTCTLPNSLKSQKKELHRLDSQVQVKPVSYSLFSSPALCTGSILNTTPTNSPCEIKPVTCFTACVGSISRLWDAHPYPSGGLRLQLPVRGSYDGSIFW